MIVVDIETTGLDPVKNSIISIGALDFSNPKKEFYGECSPKKEIDQEALKINGFKEEGLKLIKKDCFSLVKEFLEWAKKINGKTLAGENVWLDASFLRQATKEMNEEWPFGHRFLDLHSLSYYFHILDDKEIIKEDSKFSLDQTLKYLGLPEEPKPHNALTGAKVSAECLSRLIFKEKLLKDFKKYPLI
jgi:DNA polymerase III epsilon subunit-like protein